jgi:DNA transformation protein
MSVSPGFQTFVLDQLRRVAPSVRARRMFGGVGLYADDLFFALIDDDVLYFKVDDTTRADFERRGMSIFQPFGEGGATMQYYQLPEDLLEDPEALRPWTDQAIGVARRAKAKKPATRRRRS